MVAYLNSPIENLGADDTDNYQKMLMDQLRNPPQGQYDSQQSSDNQLVAALNSAANQMGTLKGRSAQAPELQRYADVLDKNRQLQASKDQELSEKTQNILGKLAQIRDQQGTKQQALAQAAKQKQDDRDFAIQQQNRQFQQQKDLLGMKGNQALSLANTKQETQQPKPSAGQQATDRAFAKTYEDFVVGGGYAEAQKGIKQLNEVADELAQNKTLTGPFRGMLPDSVRSYTNPEAVKVQQQVGDVVQRSLKSILGAQFTEKEGERVLARAYDPKAPPEINEQKIRTLAEQLQKMANSKVAAAKYWEDNNNTLTGYRGTNEGSINDLYSTIDRAAPSQNSGNAMAASAKMPKVGDVEDGHRFKGGDPSKQENWEPVPAGGQ